jgi:hypothetical protein
MAIKYETVLHAIFSIEGIVLFLVNKSKCNFIICAFNYFYIQYISPQIRNGKTASI